MSSIQLQTQLPLVFGLYVVDEMIKLVRQYDKKKDFMRTIK